MISIPRCGGKNKNKRQILKRRIPKRHPPFYFETNDKSCKEMNIKVRLSHHEEAIEFYYQKLNQYLTLGY
jgi:hypothetical protein